jgi:hypothetical protein
MVASLGPRGRLMATALAGLALVTVSGLELALASALPVSAANLTAASKAYGAPVTCTLTAVADSYANKALATTNFGTGANVQVSADLVATQRAFVQFDLTTCSPAIPPDAIVQSGTLRMTLAVLNTATRTFELRSVTGSWTETGVNWNNQPSVAGSITSSTSIPALTAAGTVATWTATSDVQAFVAGAATNLGWRLGDSAEGVVAGAILSLSAREAASGKPQLTVTYVP